MSVLVPVGIMIASITATLVNEGSSGRWMEKVLPNIMLATDDNDSCPTNSKFIVTPLTYAIINNNINYLIIHSDKNSMSELLNVVYCTIGVHQLYLSSTSSFWMLFSGTPSSSSTAS